MNERKGKTQIYKVQITLTACCAQKERTRRQAVNAIVLAWSRLFRAQIACWGNNFI